jgi:hypothetical protein
MRRREMKSLRIAAVLGIVAVTQLMCHQSILVAPPGSSMFVEANPKFIGAHGDVSIVTVFILDPTGNPVADGTVVQFFTNLGNIPEQAKTNDGVARVNFTSDSRSGRARINAFSGGRSSGASPSATTNPAGTITNSAGMAVAASQSTTLAMADALNTGFVESDVGSALPERIDVTADPPRLTDSRTSQIVANVFDKFGNPVSNVPVIFRVDNPANGFMESGGNPVYTDSSGRARDVFRTRFPRDGGAASAKIIATAPNGKTGEVTVAIN